jgi:hypothetical protein
MTHIVGIAGRLRRGSYNLSLLRAAESLMPDGAMLDVRTIAGIPLYNTDDEATAGLPPAVAASRRPTGWCWQRPNTTTAFPAPSRMRSTRRRARQATFLIGGFVQSVLEQRNPAH